jgi:hypothetical protein
VGAPGFLSFWGMEIGAIPWSDYSGLAGVWVAAGSENVS